MNITLSDIQYRNMNNCSEKDCGSAAEGGSVNIETVKQDIKHVINKPVKKWTYNEESDTYTATVELDGNTLEITFENLDIKGEDMFDAYVTAVKIKSRNLSDQKILCLCEVLKGKDIFIDNERNLLYEHNTDDVDRIIDSDLIDAIEAEQENIDGVFELKDITIKKKKHSEKLTINMEAKYE